MFGFIKNTLKRIYSAINSQLTTLFALHKIDTATLEKLERILWEADTGVTVTKKLIEDLKNEMAHGTLTTGKDLQESLQKKLIHIAQNPAFVLSPHQRIFLLVGINGSGKTTAASKLAHLCITQKKRVLFAAADTFRAAAPEQLGVWASRTGATLHQGMPGQDPASVVFQACEKFKKENFDILIIDTAGRLQTKANLMKELEKIGTIITRHLPQEQITTLLTVDAMLGQNSLDQALLFNESTKLDGIILTKLDGTGKGGIIFSIATKLHVPVAFITFGEQLDDIKAFHAEEFVSDLLSH